MTEVAARMRVKCAFCGAIYDYNMNVCPGCGAGNDKAEELDRKIYEDRIKSENKSHRIFILVIVVFLIFAIGGFLASFAPMLFMNKLMSAENGSENTGAVFADETVVAGAVDVVEQGLERLKTNEKYIAADQEGRIEMAIPVLDNLLDIGYIQEYEIHRGNGTISYHYIDGTVGEFEL